MKLKIPYLQFRFYCPAGKAFIRDYKYNGRVDELFESDVDILIAQQCTGLKDKEGKYVYEGDIIKFKYKLHPDIKDASKNSLPNSLKKLYKLKNKTIKAVVERDPCSPTNLHLVYQKPRKLERLFDLNWITKSKVVGNIFSNKI
jgi:uncharacterized phage protein (TIGR01671 family)